MWRRLFELRDFMCLHDDKISRDLFYAKLNGGPVDVEVSEKYAEFLKIGSNTVPRKTVEQMHALKNTMSQIGVVDGEIVAAERKLAWLKSGEMKAKQKAQVAFLRDD